MQAAVTKQSTCLFYDVEFEGPIKQEHCNELFEKVKDLPATEFADQKFFVLKIKHNAQVISPNFCSIICRISSHIEQAGLNFCLISDAKIKNLMVKNGIDRMIPFALSKEEFYKVYGINDKENSRIFLNCLLDSTITTMKVLLELENVTNEVAIVSSAQKVAAD